MCVLSFLGLLSNYHRVGVLKTTEMYCLTVLKARISHSLYRAMPSLKVPGKIPLPLPSFLAILGIHWRVPVSLQFYLNLHMVFPPIFCVSKCFSI